MYHEDVTTPSGPDSGRIDLGPDSLLWRWAGDSRIAFMGATIGLLQLMHPALDPETFWWAHATFQYMAEQVADRFDRHRLTPDEREQLYQEGVEWYRRYGVSDRSVPSDRAAFQEKWHYYCAEVLELNPAAEWVLNSLRRPVLSAEPLLPPQLTLLRPLAKTALARHSVFRVVRVCAFGALPPVVRARFGIEWSAVDAIALDGLELAVRNAWPIVPESVRWQPRALEGWQRVRAEREERAA
jgi:uncharacterized protein (DUF2236 family)